LDGKSMTLSSFISLLVIGVATTLLASCESPYKLGRAIPVIVGGAPKTVPPPRGTPEYDEWLKKPRTNDDK
jgi:hypothetical protein